VAWVALWRAIHQLRKYSFLMISPKLLDFSPFFFMISSALGTADFLVLLELSGDGYSLLCSKKQPPRHRKFVSFFVPWNGILSRFFLFWRVVQNKIPRVSFYFCSSVRNSKHFLFRGTVLNRIPRVFCSSEPQEFYRKKPFFCLFCLPWNFFCRKFPTLSASIARR
jgi:hypothetical protein